MSRSVVVCPDCRTPVQPKELLPTAWRGDYYDCVGCSKPLKESQFKILREMTVSRGGHVLGGQDTSVPFGREALGTGTGTGATGLATLFSGITLSAGDGLVLMLASDPAGAGTSPVTVSWNGSAMTLDALVNSSNCSVDVGGEIYSLDCFYLANAPAGSGAIVVDLTVTGDLDVWAAFVTRVIRPATTLKDRSKASSGTSATPSSTATGATLFFNELLIGAVLCEDTGISGTWSNSFTAGQNVTNGTISLEEGFRLVTDKATYTAAKTGATNTDWAAGILTCRSE